MLLYHKLTMKKDWLPSSIKPSLLIEQFMKYGPPVRDKKQVADAEFRLYVLFSIAKGQPLFAIKHRTLTGKLAKSNTATMYKIVKELQNDTVEYNSNWTEKWKHLLFDSNKDKFICVFCRKTILQSDTDYELRNHVVEHFAPLVYSMVYGNGKVIGRDIIKVLTPDEIKRRNIENQALFEIQQKM